MLTIQQVEKSLPPTLKSAATQQLVDQINNIASDPLVAEQIRENFLSYSTVLKEGRFKAEDYLNAVAELTTALAPQPLLQALQSIEQAAGRQRPYRNAPRTLDLDILWFGGQAIDTPELTVPHPRMAERAFVLRPLADLAPERADAAALQAVASQDIHRLEGPGWADAVVGG